MELTTVKKTLSVNEKLVEAGKVREAGNEFFKLGNIGKAIKKYHISLLYLKDVEKPSPLDRLSGNEPEKLSDEVLKNIFNLRCLCYNNLSATMLKKERYEKVIEYATQALSIDSQNIKALYRRGQAHYNIKDIDAAENDFLKIKEINRNETCADRYFPLLETAKKKRLQKEKDLYRKMMRNGSS